jgi:hypothetical protein
MFRSHHSTGPVRLALASLLVLVGTACGGGMSGPSPSYQWGVRVGNSAFKAVNDNGLPRELACNSFMEAGAMYADNPVLNQSPPPKNFSRSEAMQGCLDQLKKRIGY